jgi:hypothetical protein
VHISIDIQNLFSLFFVCASLCLRLLDRNAHTRGENGTEVFCLRLLLPEKLAGMQEAKTRQKKFFFSVFGGEKCAEREKRFFRSSFRSCEALERNLNVFEMSSVPRHSPHDVIFSSRRRRRFSFQFDSNCLMSCEKQFFDCGFFFRAFFSPLRLIVATMTHYHDSRSVLCWSRSVQFGGTERAAAAISIYE